MEKCADRSAHAMYKCHTCIVDTDTCFVCCKSHLCSGFQIRTVFICSRQIGKYPFDRRYGKYIGIRCRLLEVYASTACVRASIPVAAVIDFGAVTESVGSMTASLGITFSSVISFSYPLRILSHSKI